LAGELRRRGASIRFVCAELPGHLIERIEEEGYGVARLPARAEGDAAATCAALAPERPAWVVVDHYRLGAEWERALRSIAERVLAIDDLADRPHECDVLLDQNWY